MPVNDVPDLAMLHFYVITSEHFEQPQKDTETDWNRLSPSGPRQIWQVKATLSSLKS